MAKIIKPVEAATQGQSFNRASEELQIEELAWQSGFYQKPPRKITASALILGFWKMQQLGKNTLRNWFAITGFRLLRPRSN